MTIEQLKEHWKTVREPLRAKICGPWCPQHFHFRELKRGYVYRWDHLDEWGQRLYEATIFNNHARN
jgi:hypothetical protein